MAGVRLAGVVSRVIGSEPMLSAVPGRETDIEPASATSIAASAAAARLQCGGRQAPRVRGR